MTTHPHRIKIGRRPVQGGVKVMIPWRVSPRLIERLKWQALRKQTTPAQLLADIIARNCPPV
jgi:hypothetical protein